MPSLWSRWPGKGPHGWSLSIVKFVPSDNASSQHSKCSMEKRKQKETFPSGKLLAWAWCVDPCADWSRRGQYSCLPVEITRHPVQPWLDCALELRLCNTGPCSLLFLFLMVTPDFPLRRQSISGRAVYVSCLSCPEALVRQLFNGCVL